MSKVRIWRPQGALGKGILYSCMVLVANAIGIAVISLFAGQGYFSYYSLVTLLEAAALLFTGGFKVRTVLPVKALEPEIKRDWSLIVGGIVLLASSFASGYLIG